MWQFSVWFLVLCCGVLSTFGNQEPLDDFSINSLLKTLKTCHDGDVITCLGIKVVGVVERVARASQDVVLVDGVTVVANVTPTPPTRTEEEIREEVVTASAGRRNKIVEMIVESAELFLKAHAVTFDMPMIVQQGFGRMDDDDEVGRKIESKIDPVTGTKLQAFKLLTAAVFKKLVPYLLFIGFFAITAKIGVIFLTIIVLPMAAKALALAKWSLLQDKLKPFRKIVRLGEAFFGKRIDNSLTDLKYRPEKQYVGYNDYYTSGGASGVGRSTDDAHQMAFAAHASQTS